MNSTKLLRICIVTQWILIIFSVWLSFSLESKLPTPLKEWVIADAERDFTQGETIIIIALLLMLLVSIIASIGIVLLKKWGAWLYLTALVIGYIFYPFTGPVVEHALSDTFDELTVLLSGLIIGLAFFSNSMKTAEPAAVADR